MTSRGAIALIGGALVFAVAFAGTGGQIFNRVYTKAPVYGTGSSGSALSFSPDVETGWFGNCSDGDVTIATDTTITEDHDYRNLTIDAGATLRVGSASGSFAVHVCDTLTFVDATSHISNSGNDASGVTAGAPIAAGTIPGGHQGGTGAQLAGGCVTGDINGPSPGIPREATATAAGGTASTTVGGAGGAGGLGQGGGGGGGGGDGTHISTVGARALGATIVAANGDPREIFEGMTAHVFGSTTPWGDDMGGAGGGCGAGGVGTFNGAGGGGGGGAGWVVLGARKIVGSGDVVDHGGAGGAGGCTVSNVLGLPPCAGCGAGGGGAGGPGGVVILTTETYGWASIDVSGGAGGSGFCFSENSGGSGGHGGSGFFIPNYVRRP